MQCARKHVPIKSPGTSLTKFSDGREWCVQSACMHARYLPPLSNVSHAAAAVIQHRPTTRPLTVSYIRDRPGPNGPYTTKDRRRAVSDRVGRLGVAVVPGSGLVIGSDSAISHGTSALSQKKTGRRISPACIYGCRADFGEVGGPKAICGTAPAREIWEAIISRSRRRIDTL